MRACASPFLYAPGGDSVVEYLSQVIFVNRVGIGKVTSYKDFTVN